MDWELEAVKAKLKVQKLKAKVAKLKVGMKQVSEYADECFEDRRKWALEVVAKEAEIAKLNGWVD